MLDWSDVDIAVRDAVREFVDKEIRPHLDELESGDMEPYPIVRKLFATFGIDALAKESLDKRLAKLRSGESKSSGARGGMFGGGSPGMGFVVISELCRVSMGLVTGLGVSLGLTVSTIQGRGTLAQQERWLPGLVTYEKIGAWAITEPDSGSDAFGGMKSYVTRDGDDYILNGQKTFITNGPDADVVVVYAKLDEGDGADKRNRKVLTFVLDRGMEGFEQSKPFRKMGIHSSRTGELFFNNVRLGRDRLLGETEGSDGPDEGRASARSNFSAERIVVAALGEQDRPLSEFMADYQRYEASGEINFTVSDAPACVEAVLKSFGSSIQSIDHLDGVTVDLGDGSWFNLRTSNTEPLLRLNVEARTAEDVAALVDRVSAQIRGVSEPVP